ncbi:hypothetical protein GCM10022237_47690 [Nocardioides ginsengisoli]
MGVGLAVLTVAVTTMTNGGPASADPYPNEWYPDKGTYHSFCFTLAFAQHSGLVSRARYSMDNNDGVEAQTVVDTDEQSCSAATDVVFRIGDLHGKAYGSTDCVRWNGNGYCDSWAVDIDWEVIKQDAVNDGYAARFTLCHEIGHTLGVKHYPAGSSPDGATNSCMLSLLTDTGAAWTRSYGAHHRSHINNWFA